MRISSYEALRYMRELSQLLQMSQRTLINSVTGLFQRVIFLNAWFLKHSNVPDQMVCCIDYCFVITEIHITM